MTSRPFKILQAVIDGSELPPVSEATSTVSCEEEEIVNALGLFKNDPDYATRVRKLRELRHEDPDLYNKICRME